MRARLIEILYGCARVLLKGLGVLVLGLVLVVGGVWLSRPSRTPLREPLYQGVEYQRLVRSVPRPLMIHAIQVSLDAPGIRVLVTPGESFEGREVRAQTTRAFLKKSDAQVAINGSFFEPFHSNGIDDYYPHSGDGVDVIGESVSDGVRWSKSDGRRPTLCILEQGRTRRLEAKVVVGGCPSASRQSLAGHALVVAEGNVTAIKGEKLEPRSLVGIDATGTTLWLLVVDGRQDGYSEGMSLPELGALAQELGMHTALNLDGGGSSTLAMARWGYPALLNAPIHTRIPMRERPVANHLGIFALPL